MPICSWPFWYGGNAKFRALGYLPYSEAKSYHSNKTFSKTETTIKKLIFSLALCCVTPQFFAGEYTPQVQVQTLLKATQNSLGQNFSFPDSTQVHGLRVLIPAGVSTGWHVHPHSGFAYVQRGTLKVSLRDGSSQTYTPGQVFAESIRTEHEGTAIQDTVELIVFFFSEPGKAFTIKSPEHKH